ncbi:MAG: DHH family phosphoesterase [Oscillospiraceae bacterium]|nr:DHH family phosphoesterase [Oscillospiraceae bacterium]
MKPRSHFLAAALVVLLVLATLLPGIALMLRGERYGWCYCVPALAFAAAVALVAAYADRHRVRYVAKLSESCDNAKLSALQQLPVGLCVVNENGLLVQQNEFFREDVLSGRDLFGRSLYALIPVDPALDEQEIQWQQRCYHVSSIPYEQDGARLTAFLWQDVTELEQLRQDYVNTRPCVLLLVVDNYEDLIQNAKESVKLEISVAIEKLLENLLTQTGGVMRRLKNDRFFIVIEEQHVQRLIAGKFKLLDDARSIRVDEKNCVTFSIGVGSGAMTLQDSERYAVQSLDMAIGRGGDQAAVKTENGFRFFGGVSKGVEKKSRAKTRIIAGAVQELILNSRNVYLMGHRFGDFDSIGGCCGLAGAVRLMGVPVHVVVDPERNLSGQLIDLVREEAGEELFITPQQALEGITENTLLIIVDTHNKDILESPALYQAAKKVVVIDHHRKNVNYVDNALVFHHEPYASSACEMVAELLQYFRLRETPDSLYADCLLSGIMLDTKNFIMRTGVRTFEAAAYLRRIGADTVRVKGLFSGSIEAYRSRTEIVSSAQLTGRYAIAIAPEGVSDIRLAAPQAADELLSISHVEAAFVIYAVGDAISISARSLGAVNVQVIMEQLGGGGHQTMAATQITDVTPGEAKERLLRVLEEQSSE